MALAFGESQPIIIGRLGAVYIEPEDSTKKGQVINSVADSERTDA
jgi:hypothetical protein